MQIEVTLDVFKALVARLTYDGQTMSELIGDLLNGELPLEVPNSAEEGVGVAHEVFLRQANRGGFASRKLWLPDKTELRARYKHKEYRARIDNNAWVDESGRLHSSPSAAARAITGNSVNGLRFWEALRPGDRTWRRIDSLVME
ncbi:MAG: DUF4357 domain-containing protein [Sphingobium sp.]|nr:DUF4357 domain-containing protein [Sphingobium sp.]